MRFVRRVRAEHHLAEDEVGEEDHHDDARDHVPPVRRLNDERQW
jgi:hypothetical protein